MKNVTFVEGGKRVGRKILKVVTRWYRLVSERPKYLFLEVMLIVFGNLFKRDSQEKFLKFFGCNFLWKNLKDFKLYAEIKMTQKNLPSFLNRQPKNFISHK